MSKTINVNELQSQISGVLKNVQEGETYQVMRYSQPIAVVLSFSEYQKLRGECRACIQDLRKIAQKAK